MTTSATRNIRWVEAFRDPKQPVFWNQAKSGKLGERNISIPSDRNSNFQYAAKGKAKPKNKYDEATRKALHDEAQKVLSLIDEVADGEVTSFFYSVQDGVLRYSQNVKFDGQVIAENKESSDDTLLDAALNFAEFVASKVGGSKTVQIELPSEE
jgi:hypothetical protein